MFNLQGSEIIFILLIALVVLGPEKLPGAIRRAMRTYQELRKMGDGFQSEFRKAVDEPLREMRETANLIQDQADPKKIAEDAEKAAHAAAKKEAQREQAVAEMRAAGERAKQADAADGFSDTDAEAAWRADMESSTAESNEWDDPLDDEPAQSAGEIDVDWGSPAGAPVESLAPPPSAGSAQMPPGLPADPTLPPADDESAA